MFEVDRGGKLVDLIKEFFVFIPYVGQQWLPHLNDI
jgi:hypothetical protein